MSIFDEVSSEQVIIDRVTKYIKYWGVRGNKMHTDIKTVSITDERKNPQKFDFNSFEDYRIFWQICDPYNVFIIKHRGPISGFVRCMNHKDPIDGKQIPEFLTLNDVIEYEFIG